MMIIRPLRENAAAFLFGYLIFNVIKRKLYLLIKSDASAVAITKRNNHDQ
jgi:hypothetical protein